MAGHRLVVKAFAGLAALLMLFVVADTNVVKAASADPTLPWLITSASSDNSTPPAPPPPPPLNDTPQRDVEPGTITQAWDNSSFEPSAVLQPRDVLMVDLANETSYDATYGYFSVNKTSPLFIRVLTPRADPQDIADTVFSVLYQGVLLSPANGAVDNATATNLSFHYGLYLGPIQMGKMTIDYAFMRDANKITISFSPSVGLPEEYQIAWLTFTSWKAVDTACPGDIEQRFEDLPNCSYGGLFLGPDVGTLYGTGSIGIPGAIIREDKTEGSLGGPSIRMDASDAGSDFNATYAGKLNFSGYSGNAVLSTFLPGHLVIDPQLVQSSVSATATAYSIQRKAFFDGSRYWLFYQKDATTVYYLNSVDGKTWNPPAPGNVAITAGGFQYGFTVINSGNNTVGVLWTDSSDPTRVHIRTGLITEGTIQWDDTGTTGRQLQYPCCTNSVNTPVSATFTSQGREFGITWRDTAGGIGYMPYLCSTTTSGFSDCATQTNEMSGPDWGTGLVGTTSSMVVAFADGTSRIARFVLDSDPSGTKAIHLLVKVYTGNGILCGTQGLDVNFYNILTISPGNLLWSEGLFTGAAYNQKVVLAAMANYDTGAYLYHWSIDAGCNAVTEYHALGNYGKYLSAGTEKNGVLYLFFTLGGSNYYSRITPEGSFGFAVSAIFSGYAPTHITTAQFSSHFIPVAFTSGVDTPHGCTGTCLFYSNFPLPLDGEASTTNPWSTKLGAPLITEVGGVISPTTGLLAAGQPLIVGQPAISILYKEPGLFSSDGTRYYPDDGYGIIPGIYWDLPWITGTGFGAGQPVGELHMTGGQTYALSLTGSSGSLRWYNITKGMRYTLAWDVAAFAWTLTMPSGANLKFLGEGGLTDAYMDTTGNNRVIYFLPGSLGGTITASSRTITFTTTGLTYGNGQSQSIVLSKTLGTWTASDGRTCSGSDVDTTNSGKLQVTDAMGRATTYWVCKWRLSRLESSNGGRVDYSYTTGTQTTDARLVTYVSQGTEAYSAPVTKMDIYNESAANVKARSLVFNWVFQNGEVVRALVNTTDKSAVVQGTNEYIFNPAAGTASVRTYDSAGQVLYYDMETCTASPCGGTLKDLSGNANSGTLNGFYTFPFARYGKGIDVQGGGWVQTADSGSLDATNGVTLSAWIRPSLLTGTQRIISKWGDTTGERSYFLSLGDPGSGKLRFEVYSNGNTVIADSTAAISASYWSWVAGTYDGRTATIYVNTWTLPSASSLSGWGNPVQVTSTPVGIGNEGDGSGVKVFYGTIDEVRIFNRALSSEDIGSLYTKNAMKRGEQKNWYSINDQPHMAEGLVGDETTPSVVTQDAIDDWGNQIYHRTALGEETFVSYANTNHQNHFYAPGGLTENPYPFPDMELTDFSDGIFPTGSPDNLYPERRKWTVTVGAPSPSSPIQLDYGMFDKIAPSLKLTTPPSQSTKVAHALSTIQPKHVEVRARVSTQERFEIRFDGLSQTYIGLRFTASGTIEARDGQSGLWNACTVPGHPSATYSANSWKRLTFSLDWRGTEYSWTGYLDGMDLSCGTLKLGAITFTDTNLVFEAFGTGANVNAWVDDIKIYSKGYPDYVPLGVGFDGLQLRQTIALVGEDGSVIDQTMQTGSSTVWLSFNSILTGVYKHYENGDNTRTLVRIYAEDGTLEYQSPLTRFFTGDKYTYTRPRAFADEVAKTRSGALYISNTNSVYADDSCSPASITCYGFTWASPPAVPSTARGSNVHITPFHYGDSSHYFLWTQGGPLPSLPVNFTTYVFLPSGRSPDGISLWLKLPAGGSQQAWYQAYWGTRSYTAPEPAVGIYGAIRLGDLPARGQWVRLWLRPSDFLTGQTQWAGFGYSAIGGEVLWDATTLEASSSLLTVSGLTGLGSNLKVSVYDSVKGVEIANNSGFVSGDSTTINFWPWYFAFPVRASIKICSSTSASSGCNGKSTETDEYYFGPLRDIWPGDTFRYIGASSFFNPKTSSTSYWPGPTVHTSQIGAKKFSGDCASASTILCYDMETRTETATAVDTGVVSSVVLDLSGKGSHGTIGGVPGLSAIDKAAAGLGTTFNAGSDEVAFTMPVNTASGGWNTVSFWMYWTGANGQMPFGFSLYDLYFACSGFGFNTGNADVWGIDTTNLLNKLVYVTAEFYNGAGTTSKLYINGVQQTLSQKCGTALSRTATGNAKISGWPTDALYKFGGTIDQVQVYNRALTDIEILALYYSRAPGAPQIYLQPTNSPAGSGLIRSSRVPYEGTYLYAVATYDSKGHVLSVTDVGRASTGGVNVTSYQYSSLDSGDYVTKVTRPFVVGDSGSLGRPVYYAYDFQTGVKYGTLDVDCRRSRMQYDAMGRPTQTSVYGAAADSTSETLHWDMETFDGGAMKDVSCALNSVPTYDSRNGYLGTVSGTTSSVSGVEGMARHFDGSTGRINTASPVTTSLTFTVSAWLKPSTLNQVGLAVYNGQGNANGYGFGISGITGQLYGLFGGVIWINAGYSFPDTTSWHLVTMTRSGTTTTIYVDGKQTYSGNPGTPIAPLSATEVGYDNYAGTTRYFNGDIDDVRVFTTALSATDVLTLRGFKYSLLTSSSVAYDDMTAFPEFFGYPGASVTSYDGVSMQRSLFLDMQAVKATIGSVSYLEDLSGSGNHGKVTGTTVVAGKVGSARQFNGGTDIVKTGKPIPVFNSLTVAAWVNRNSTQADSLGDVYHNNFAGQLKVSNTGTVYAQYYDGAVWRVLTSIGTVPAGTWTHIAMTFAPSGGNTVVSIYRNGLLDTSQTFTGTPTPSGMTYASFGGYDGTQERYKGIIDELQAIPESLSASQVSDLYNGYTTGSATYDPSHSSRTYTDGLGRATLSVIMDIYGKSIQTFATLGWNDQPLYSYTPSGGYFTYTYDFLGRTLTAQTPGDSTVSGISGAIISEKARLVETVDSVGRKAYQKTDILGRTIETAVWNPATGAYGNKTSATYNALSKVVTSKDSKGQTTMVYYNSFGKPKMTVFPDNTYSYVIYDDNLRAFQAVDVMGRVATSTYDSLGRAIKSSLKAPPATNTYDTFYDYDPVHDDLLVVQNGTVNSARTTTGTAKLTYTYDSLHRLKTEKLDVPATGTPAFTGTTTYTYDNAGKITDIQYPATLNTHASYKYDSLGRAVEVDYGSTSPYPKYVSLTYDSVGRLDNIHYYQAGTDTTIQEKYTYDARDRVTQVKVFDSGSTIYMQLDYVYNKASEIASSTDNMYVSDGGSNGVSNPKTITYNYNGNGRLSQAIGPFGASQASQTLQWTYDQVGNLLTSKVGATTYTYTYGASPAWNLLNSFSLNSMSFTYNAAGSMTCKTESSAYTKYTHDFLQQLVTVQSGASSCTGTGGTTYTYSYDGAGRRVKTYDGTTTSYFMYSGSKMLYSKATSETAFVYVGDKLLLRKEGTGATPEARYYHQDLSGSVRFISYYASSAVQTEAKWRYKPFGDLVWVYPTSGTPGRFQFARQEFDSLVRLYHLGARYYDPLVGRFIERDPIGSGYSYASNNPISFSDPTGMLTEGGTPWQNFRNWLGSSQGRMVVGLVTAALDAALIVSVFGMPIKVLITGLIVGAIFVAGTAVISGGKAAAEDYIAAFSFGFVVGTTLGFALGFGVAKEAATLGAAKPGLSGALSNTRAAKEAGAAKTLDVVSREAPLVRGTFRGAEMEGYVIDGRFVPRIEGGSGLGDELDFARRMGGGARNLGREIRVGGQTLTPDYLDESIIGETTRGGLSQRKMFQITRYMEYARDTGRTVVLEFQSGLSAQELAWVSAKAMQYEVTTWTMLPETLVFA